MSSASTRTDSPGRPGTDRQGRSRGGDLLLLLLTCIVIGLAIAVITGLLGPLRHSPTSDSRSTPRTKGSQPYQRTPPAALPATGSYQRTTIGRKGSVKVTQWIRTRKPLKAITVSPESGSSGTAKATDLVVAAGKVRVQTPGTVGAKGRRITLGRPAKLVYLSYHLTGVLDRKSSVAGRVLVQATAVRLTYRHRTGPAVVRVQAPKITSMACKDVPLGETTASTPASLTYVCGTPAPSGWTVKLTKKHRGATVSAQVELR